MTKQEMLNGMSEEEFYRLYPTEDAYKKAMGGTPTAFPQQPTMNKFFDYGVEPFGEMFYMNGGNFPAFPDGGPTNPVPGYDPATGIHNLQPGQQPLTDEQLQAYGRTRYIEGMSHDMEGPQGWYKVNPYTPTPVQQAPVNKPKFPRVGTPEWDANQAAVLQQRAQREALFSGQDLAMQAYGGQPCFECGGNMQDGGVPPGYHMMPDGTMMADADMQYKKGGNPLIGDTTEETQLDIIKNTFLNTLKTNNEKSMSGEIGKEVNQNFEQLSQNFAQMGMSMENYGYNPNQGNQQMFTDRYNELGEQGKQAGKNFFGASLDLMDSSYMDYAQDGKEVSSQTPNRYRLNPQTGKIEHYYQNDPGFDAEYRKSQVTNNYYGSGIPMPSGQSYRRNTGFPANYRNDVRWDTKGRDADIQRILDNSEDTYLRNMTMENKYGAMDRFLTGMRKGKNKGKHFFGPKSTSMSITFRTYIDPVTGEETQVPVNSEGEVMNQGSQGETRFPYLPSAEQEAGQQLPAWAPPGLNAATYPGAEAAEAAAQDNRNRTPWRIGDQTRAKQGKKNWTDYYQEGGPFGQEECTDQDRMNKLSPCYEPGWTPGQTNYIENMGTVNEPAFATADELYGKDPLNKDNMGVNPPKDFFDTTFTAKGKRKMDGESMANWALAGTAGLTSMINAKERNKLKDEMQQNTLADNQFSPMPAGENRGMWNWTGMSTGMIDPYKTGEIVQQRGYAKHGGAYQEGGEYEMDEAEIEEFLRNGGSISYLD